MNNKDGLNFQVFFGLRILVHFGAIVLVSACATSKPELEKFHSSARVQKKDFPDAPAVVLLDRTELVFTFSALKSRPYAEQLHTLRIQILSPEALDLARYQIPYDDRSAIFHVQARRIDKNGVVENMMADRVLDVGRFRKGTPAAKLYGGNGYKLTKISNVQVGDVIEFSYLRVYRDPRWVDPIAVTGYLPVVRGEVVIDYPKQFDVDFRVSRSGRLVTNRPVKLPTRVKSVDAKGEGVSGTRLIFLFENERAVFPEEEMPSMAAVSVQVHPQLRGYTLGGKRYQGYSSWDDVAKWYNQLIQGNDRTNAKVAQVVRDIGGKEGRKRDKLKRVQRFLQDNIGEIPTFLNLAALPVNSPADLVAAGFGDAKDQASLGLAMLREMEIDGFPVLVSRFGSNAFLPDFTTPSSFNHVLIAIPSGGRYAFIDPSSPDIPTGRLPGELQGQLGLLIRSDRGEARAEVIELPIDPPMANTRRIDYQISLAKNGVAAGQAQVVLEGLEATRARRILRSTGPERLTQMREFLEFGETSKLNWVEVIVVGGEKAQDPDASLKLQIVFGASEIGIVQDGDFSFHMRSSMGQTLAHASREIRNLPMVFPYQYFHEVNMTISLPEEMGVEALPASSHIETNQLHVDDLWSVANGEVFMEHDLQLRTRVVSPEDYGRFRQSLQVVWAGENWPMVVTVGGNRGDDYGNTPF